ncbi:unnamed protein product [Polarella glacialis]|uniref:Uncharacterized protein n=1 Tax=Polarella glacialis TaxID=89957 RepID=A0A813LIS2_POLGL|nr:unnamed protein product [Polarella glacialis]
MLRNYSEQIVFRSLQMFARQILRRRFACCREDSLDEFFRLDRSYIQSAISHVRRIFPFSSSRWSFHCLAQMSTLQAHSSLALGTAIQTNLPSAQTFDLDDCLAAAPLPCAFLLYEHSLDLAAETMHASARTVLEANVLEFPVAAVGSGGGTWLSWQGAAVTMLMTGLSYCCLRAFLTGFRQVTCLEPPGGSRASDTNSGAKVGKRAVGREGIQRTRAREID